MKTGYVGMSFLSSTGPVRARPDTGLIPSPRRVFDTLPGTSRSPSRAEPAPYEIRGSSILRGMHVLDKSRDRASREWSLRRSLGRFGGLFPIASPGGILRR